MPKAKSTPTPRKMTMAMTLMLASQNSTSPKVRTEMMLVQMKRTNRIAENSHDGSSGNQPLSILPPSTDS